MFTTEEFNKQMGHAQTTGQAGRANDIGRMEPMRLIDRVAKERAHLESLLPKAMELAELEHLLKKNPEVARILELMEKVKV